MEEQKPDLEIVKKKPTYNKFDKAYADLVAEEGKQFKENKEKWTRQKLNTMKLNIPTSPTYNSKPFDLIQRNMLPSAKYEHNPNDYTQTTNGWSNSYRGNHHFITSEYGIRASAIGDAIKGVKTKLSTPSINHVAAMMYLNGPHLNKMHDNFRACDWNLGCGIGAEPYEDYRRIHSNNPFEDEMTQLKLKDSKYYGDHYKNSKTWNEFDHSWTRVNNYGEKETGTNPQYFHEYVNDDDHWIDLNKPIADLDKEPNKEGNK